jgi:hypothetical protein
MEKMQINGTPVGSVLEIRQGDAKRLYNYKGYSYTANSTDSLIKLVKSKGSQANSVIAYNDDGIKVILDDTVVDREHDRIGYSFKHSLQYEEWESILTRGCAFDQKEFIKFLQRREEGEVQDIESLMGAIQQFKYVTQITGDFTYDNNNNYTFGFKIGEAEGTVRLPQLLYVNIEVYLESGLEQMTEIELEVRRPKSENEKPTFVLTCPKLSRYLKTAVDHEITKLKTELDGYLIVAGNI